MIFWSGNWYILQWLERCARRRKWRFIRIIQLNPVELRASRSAAANQNRVALGVVVISCVCEVVFYILESIRINIVQGNTIYRRNNIISVEKYILYPSRYTYGDCKYTFGILTIVVERLSKSCFGLTVWSGHSKKLKKHIVSQGYLHQVREYQHILTIYERPWVGEVWVPSCPTLQESVDIPKPSQARNW